MRRHAPVGRRGGFLSELPGRWFARSMSTTNTMKFGGRAGSADAATAAIIAIAIAPGRMIRSFSAIPPSQVPFGHFLTRMIPYRAEIQPTVYAAPMREAFPNLQLYVTERALSVIAKTQLVFPINGLFVSCLSQQSFRPINCTPCCVHEVDPLGSQRAPALRGSGCASPRRPPKRRIGVPAKRATGRPT